MKYTKLIAFLLMLVSVVAWAEIYLPSKVITAVFPDRFYIEEPDRSSGIAVKYDGELPEGMTEVVEGMILSVKGEIQTFTGGERYIDASSIELEGRYYYLPPRLAKGVGMNNVLVGGESFGAFTVGVQGGFGLNNIGLFVTSWGRVSDIQESSFVISDGSLQGGVKVDATGLTKPTFGAYVTVVGISSIDPTTLGRLLKPRSQEDIVAIQ